MKQVKNVINVSWPRRDRGDIFRVPYSIEQHKIQKKNQRKIFPHDVRWRIQFVLVDKKNLSG